MKYAVSSDQRDYFRKNGFIPLSGILKNSEVQDLNLGIEAALKKTPSTDYFAHGRDLWRASSQVKKIVFSTRLVELAFEFLQRKPLRLAFDQLLPEQPKTHFYPDTPFQDASGISDLMGMYLLILKTDPSADAHGMEAGSGYFLLPSAPFPFSSLEGTSRYFLIGYTGLFSQYLYQPRDSHGHFLKTLGYVFGDKLHEQFHPILLR